MSESSIELSVGLALRNDESLVPEQLDLAARVGTGASEGYEILALDQGSSDNTLSVLSLLHGDYPVLRTVQDLNPGMAVSRFAQMARGRHWLWLDGPADPELARWAVAQVRAGHVAAIVDKEALGVQRAFGQATLGWVRGGLGPAQAAVEKGLRARGERPAWSPASRSTWQRRTETAIRTGLARFGIR